MILKQKQSKDIADKPEKTQKKAKPKKPRKKHRFLKFLLLVALVLLSYKGAQKVCDHIAEKKLYQFADRYPFEFYSDYESIEYLYNNFTVPVSYDYKGKTYSVSWVSDSSYITIDDEGNATVKEPETKSVSVTLKQEYSFLIGKAALTYNANVITANEQDISEIPVIDKKEVIDGTYPRKMKLQLNPENNDQVRYMDGDFGNFHIYNTEDALTAAEAYRDVLGIHPDIIFWDAICNPGSLYTLYIIPAYYHSMQIEGSSLMFTVYRETGEVTKITNSIFETPETLTGEIEINYAEDMIKEWNDKSKMISEPYQIYDNGYSYINGVLVEKSIIYSSDGGIYEALISDNSVNVRSLSQNLFLPEEAQCSGKTEDNREIKFPATLADFGAAKEYRLNDVNRKIQILDNEFFWICSRKLAYEGDVGAITLICALGEIYAGSKISVNIKSETSEFADSIAVETYTGLQNVYDYYAKNFSRYSYDGKSHTITAITDCRNCYDNASWTSGGINAFFINPPKKYKYAVVFTPEVLAHEYTHAVFDSASSSSASIEYKGINEAYADVFGCLATDSKDWIIGTNYRASDGTPLHIRDLLNFNTTEEGFELTNEVCTKYKDEVWKRENGEEHTICVLISHVAAKMDKSVYFDKKDISKIWYNSISNGFNDDSTFVDARKNIIKAAEDLGYSKEKTDFIAYQFDLEEIYDPSYQITTPEFIIGPANPVQDNSVYITNGNVKEGNLLYDDTQNRNFIFAVSLIGLKFFDMPICILEDDVKASEEDIAKAEEVLTQKMSDLLLQEDDTLNVSVKILILPKPIMKFLTSLAERFENETNNFSKPDAEMLSYGIMFDCENMTAYRFYKSMGLI